ncbi:hypothetical protein B0H10DRAFT_2203852 [Mycena sp. CBHHK59/15]|nr:hypothetical protein B0H10DRAFT_2203852 [Mycena sp. CBHHK59/15]
MTSISLGSPRGANEPSKVGHSIHIALALLGISLAYGGLEYHRPQGRGAVAGGYDIISLKFASLMKGWSALANFALDDLAVTSAHQHLTSKSREYAEHAEEARLREVDAKRKIAARKRADATERMQRFRAREREEKIANGWVAGQKRKRVELVDVDETVSATDITMAELSRPSVCGPAKRDLVKILAGQPLDNPFYLVFFVNWSTTCMKNAHVEKELDRNHELGNW